MDNLQKTIISNYYKVINKLKQGYRPELEDLFNQIIFENNKIYIDNNLFIESALSNILYED